VVEALAMPFGLFCQKVSGCRVTRGLGAVRKVSHPRSEGQPAALFFILLVQA
jgi:hypothetical protein